MKNSKRKILIAISFAILMLMVPLASAVTDNKTVENLQTQQTQQKLMIKARNSKPGVINVIYMIAEDLVQELLDAGLNVNENTEVIQAQMQQILATEGDVLTTDLDEMLCEELLVSGEDPMGQGIEDTGVGSISGEVSGSYVVENPETGMELEGTSSEIEYFESYQNIYLYLAGDLFTDFNPNQIKDRLGWVADLVEYMNGTYNAWDEWKETWIPNVTWIDVIEDWFSYLGISIDVEQIFLDIETRLLEKFAGHPLIEIIIQAVLQWIYDHLNTKVGNNLKDLKDKFMGAIKTFLKVWFGKITDISPKKAFRRIIFWALFFSLDGWLVFMHTIPYPDRWEEWNITRLKARQNFSENISKFFDWLHSGYNGQEPWLEPVHINGTVTGLTVEQLLETIVYCEKDQPKQVTADENGYFEGLDFITCDENSPRGLHKCVTTASNSEGSITLGVHSGSGSKLQNILEVGAFSGGTLTLTFDFDNPPDNSYVVETQSSMTMAQQTTTTQQTTTQNK